jgi:hypothetical protein
MNHGGNFNCPGIIQPLHMVWMWMATWLQTKLLNKQSTDNIIAAPTIYDEMTHLAFHFASGLKQIMALSLFSSNKLGGKNSPNHQRRRWCIHCKGSNSGKSASNSSKLALVISSEDGEITSCNFSL